MLKKFFSVMLTLMFSVGSAIGTIPPSKIEKILYYSDSYTNGGTNAVSFNEIIEFTSFSHNDTLLEKGFPVYQAAYGTNNCAPTAGAMTIAYYDATYDDLIPNCTVGYYYNDTYFFRAQQTVVNQLMETLYNYMGTNTEEPGTSVTQFRNGMTQYINERGFNVTFTQLASPFSTSTAINYFTNQTPIILFLNSYEYYPLGGITFYDDYISMVGYTKTVGHVVVASGYMVYNFYNADGLFRTDYYLMASFGDDTSGFLKINSTACIQEAWTLNITPTTT